MDVAMNDVPSLPRSPEQKACKLVESSCSDMNATDAPIPIVHVEVCLKSRSTAPSDEVEQRVREHLKSAVMLKNGPFSVEKDELLDSHLESITILLPHEDSSTLAFFHCQTDIHVYQLAEDEVSEEVQEGGDGESEIVAANSWVLPNRHFHGMWESLIFDHEIKKHLLDYATSAMYFSDRQVDSTLVVWNRVVLLHGPPGTGKTSLCKALAHKLSIRLSDRFQVAQILEVNSHSLFSKWFSESGKLVQQLFTRIQDLVEDKSALVCVLIDEVESLTAARTSALGGSEPSDAIRVVNALLTQLDQLKRHENVMILTTSNITAAMDVAFLDRADIKQYIGLPGVRARYEILRSCLNELKRVKIITNQAQDVVYDYLSYSSKKSSSSNSNSSASAKLESVSELCDGFSGRALRKLPFQAHALYIQRERCSMKHFLEGLERSIRKEITERELLGS